MLLEIMPVNQKSSLSQHNFCATSEAMKYRFVMKEIRESAGIKQAQLVTILKEPQWRVSRWENGVVQPDAEQIIRIAEALHVAPGKLFRRVKNNRTE